jgi:hypothetical protein
MGPLLQRDLRRQDPMALPEGNGRCPGPGVVLAPDVPEGDFRLQSGRGVFRLASSLAAHDLAQTQGNRGRSSHGTLVQLDR